MYRVGHFRMRLSSHMMVIWGYVSNWDIDGLNPYVGKYIGSTDCYIYLSLTVMKLGKRVTCLKDSRRPVPIIYNGSLRPKYFSFMETCVKYTTSEKGYFRSWNSGGFGNISFCNKCIVGGRISSLKFRITAIIPTYKI